MSYSNTQDKPGTPWQRQSNPEKPARKRSEPDRDPTIAQSKTDALGNHITTNYPMKKSSPPPHNSGGPLIEGQHLRGYVHNDTGRRVGTVQDGNRMGLDMDRTIQKISPPAGHTGPAKPDGKTGGSGQAGD